jgi:hypothetical protein
LRAALSGESKAYGFALVVWGSGALAVDKRGMPHPFGVLAYVGGALLATIAVLLVSFGGPTGDFHARRLHRLAFGGLHIVSIAGALAIALLASSVIRPRVLAFLLTGFGASIVYHLLLGLEVAFSIVEPKGASS